MPHRSSLSRWFLRVVAPPVVLIGGVAGYVGLASLREPPEPVDTSEPAPLVETMAVTTATGALRIKADGVVVPYRNISVGAQVSGRILEKSRTCQAGRVVSEGEVLLRIDPASYELAVERWQRERATAEASVKELEVTVENTATSIAVAQDELALKQADVARIESLQDRGVSTQQALDAAKLAALQSREALVTLQNKKRLLTAQRSRMEQAVKLAAAQLDQAKLDLRRTAVRAPVDGVIVSCDVEQGGYVAVGDLVVELSDTSAVEVETHLEMRTLAWLRANVAQSSQSESRGESKRKSPRGPYELPPVPVTVLYEVLGNVYSWSGVLDRVAGVGLDAQTRTVPCRILVKSPRSVSLRSGSSALPVAPPPALVRGMYVKLVFHSSPVRPLLSIPQVAVQPDGAVWAVRDGVLAKFPLLGSRVIEGDVLVAPGVTGLRPGEAVVVSPLPFGREGMAVRLQKKSADEAVPRAMTSVARDGAALRQRRASVEGIPQEGVGSQ